MEDLPDSSVSRQPKNDPCVRLTGLGQHDEVTVARHQYSAQRISERQLLQVGGAIEFLLDGGCHIDSPQPQASGNGGVDALIEVVLDIQPGNAGRYTRGMARPPSPHHRPRPSNCMARSHELERDRIARLSVEERILMALGLRERYAGLEPILQVNHADAESRQSARDR